MRLDIAISIALMLLAVLPVRAADSGAGAVQSAAAVSTQSNLGHLQALQPSLGGVDGTAIKRPSFHGPNSPHLRKILRGGVTMPVIRTLVFGPDGCVNCSDSVNPNSSLGRLMQHSSPGVEFSYAGPPTTTTTWSYTGTAAEEPASPQSRGEDNSYRQNGAPSNVDYQSGAFQYGGSLPTVIQGCCGGFAGSSGGTSSFNPDSNSTGFEYGGSLPTVIQFAPAP